MKVLTVCRMTAGKAKNFDWDNHRQILEDNGLDISDPSRIKQQLLYYPESQLEQNSKIIFFVTFKELGYKEESCIDEIIDKYRQYFIQMIWVDIELDCKPFSNNLSKLGFAKYGGHYNSSRLHIGWIKSVSVYPSEEEPFECPEISTPGHWRTLTDGVVELEISYGYYMGKGIPLPSKFISYAAKFDGEPMRISVSDVL